MQSIANVFKKCMLVDEEDFDKCSNQGYSSLKSFVQSLGMFVGNLTLAKNEPIRAA